MTTSNKELLYDIRKELKILNYNFETWSKTMIETMIHVLEKEDKK